MLANPLTLPATSLEIVVYVVVLLQRLFGQWPLSTISVLEAISLTLQAEQQLDCINWPVFVTHQFFWDHVLGVWYLVQELLTCGTLSESAKEANGFASKKILHVAENMAPNLTFSWASQGVLQPRVRRKQDAHPMPCGKQPGRSTEQEAPAAFLREKLLPAVLAASTSEWGSPKRCCMGGCGSWECSQKQDEKHETSILCLFPSQNGNCHMWSWMAADLWASACFLSQRSTNLGSFARFLPLACFFSPWAACFTPWLFPVHPLSQICRLQTLKDSAFPAVQFYGAHFN